MGYIERASALEHYLTINNDNISKMEYEAFCVNGKHLMPKEQIILEYSKIKSVFSFDIDFEYEKYKEFNELIKRLGAYVCLYDKLTNEQKEVLKKIIVFLELELGTKVSFYKTFMEMKKNRELLVNYEMLSDLGKFDLDTLFTFYGKSIKKQKHPSFKENIERTINSIETNPMYMKVDDEGYMLTDYVYQLTCMYNNLISETNENKEKSKDFIRIIKSLLASIEKNDLTVEDRDLIEKTIVYLELETGTNVSYLDTFMNMITDGQLELDYDELREDGNLTMEKITEVFKRRKGNGYSGK